MIKVNKNFEDIPNILTPNPTRGVSRENVFNQNIASASYCDTKNSYKVKSVQTRLYEIYHLKCAYCEKKLLDIPKHIEHYRPKSYYYWLAYSWDNLLLSCGSCNIAKGSEFDTENEKVTYNNEQFSDIHNLSDGYDEIEKPKLINPEKEDVLAKLVFDIDCKMSSQDCRVQYTIEDVCHLNRVELLQRRQKIVNDFKNVMNEHYLYFSKEGGITRFIPDIENFINECKIENEFYAFRYFVINNIEIFFEDELLTKIIKKLIAKIEADV